MGEAAVSASPTVDRTERERECLKLYGRYDKYVDANEVRAHIDRLREAGMGLKTIAKRSGVSSGALTKIVYGVYAPGSGGCKGAGDLIRPPARRVTRAVADRLYAVSPDDLADRAVVPAHGTVLRVRALVALGWSQSKIASRLGIKRSNFYLAGTMQTSAARARAVRALYDELSMTLPPQDDWRDKIAAGRARKYASERGWLPPLALDDARLDDPGYEPWFEHGTDVHPDDDPEAAA